MFLLLELYKFFSVLENAKNAFCLLNNLKAINYCKNWKSGKQFQKTKRKKRIKFAILYKTKIQKLFPFLPCFSYVDI